MSIEQIVAQATEWEKHDSDPDYPTDDLLNEARSLVEMVNTLGGATPEVAPEESVLVEYTNDLVHSVNGFFFKDVEIKNPTYSVLGFRPQYYGFEIYHTGGGCEAMRLDLKDGFYIYLTATDGISVPVFAKNRPFWMGLYDKEDQQIWIKTLMVGVKAGDEEKALKVIAENAMDAAARHIQTELGVTTGDFASLFFSDGLTEIALAKYADEEFDRQKIN